jgi:hypothetical protein
VAWAYCSRAPAAAIAGRSPFGAEAGERGDLELLAEQALGRVEFEMPVRLAGARGFPAKFGCQDSG